MTVPSGEAVRRRRSRSRRAFRAPESVAQKLVLAGSCFKGVLLRATHPCCLTTTTSLAFASTLAYHGALACFPARCRVRRKRPASLGRIRRSEGSAADRQAPTEGPP